MRYGKYILSVGVCALLLSLASGTATAQIRLPANISPDLLDNLLPPATPMPPVTPSPQVQGYPPTTAPSASGTYLATFSWSQTLPNNSRFIILTNFNSDAVLDRETGVVWARQNVEPTTWRVADYACKQLVIGNRRGWRLASRWELNSLLDPSLPDNPNSPRLPSGHPFLMSLVAPAGSQAYWTGDLNPISNFERAFATEMVDGDSTTGSVNQSVLAAMCVRGRE